MGRTPRLTHVALRVKNIEKSAAFYRKYLGLEVIAQRQEHKTRVAWLGNPRVKEDFVIVLLELPYEASPQPSYDHFGLDLPTREAVDEYAAMAEADGLLEFGPETMGPVANYLCLIRDPDGNGIEFSYGQDIESVLENHTAEKERGKGRI
ncbi:MAG TPA: VOC family protein [bacterium]|nr:VOC family protein [Candidatus Omnitrophota bacterium]HOJ61358.1 VOC family protein [bacterium]HOL95202.1 VOC family protein [bacterium]HPP01624.1 VOC family protein [bacterium]HXK92557.1 VOC family protein [bacterium]